MQILFFQSNQLLVHFLVGVLSHAQQSSECLVLSLQLLNDQITFLRPLDSLELVFNHQLLQTAQLR